LVGLIAWLSQHPTVRQALEVATGLASLMASAGAVVDYFRGAKRGWLYSLPWLLASWAVLWCARPQLTKPSVAEIRSQLTPQAEAYVAGLLDLLLALVWASPRREAAKPEQAEKATGLPESLLQAFSILHLLLQEQPLDAAKLVGPARTLLARLRSAGYEWQDVPTGARYTETLEECFECFGLTKEGEALEMIEPAVLHRGQVVIRGKLRAIPS
ncbi:MAG: hypothetical protein SNJ82_12435, partial [Gemmataceae bacterium]